MILLTFVVAAFAHNWVNSPSRVDGASTVNPAVPSSTGEPHLQVRPGQDFHIEWVNGHDGDGYFVLLAEDNAIKNMLMHKTAMMDDYINNAPNGGNASIVGTKWGKYHRKYNNVDLNNNAGDGMFKQAISMGGANYIARPNVFEGRFRNCPSGLGSKCNNTLIKQMVYNSGPCVDFDRRAQYKSPKYPWVIAIHRFRYCTGQATEPDIALFQFPPGTPAGNYLVQWQWRGYYDVIDVKVVDSATDVSPVYFPKPPLQPGGLVCRYKRVDHCAFLEPTPVHYCMRMITDAQGCKDACDRLNDLQCSGINIQPIVAPPNVYKNFKANVSSLIPYSFSNLCSKSQLESGATPYDRVCYALIQRAKTDTANSYVITDDPEDPVFYSTCLFRVPGQCGATTPPPPPPPRDLVWQFRDKCAECDEAQYARNNEAYLPKWNVSASGKCQNCDIDGPKFANLPPLQNYSLPVPWTKQLPDGTCQGHFGGTYPSTYTCNATESCIRQLSLPSGGGGDISERDCYTLAKNNPLCSKWVYKAKPYNKDLNAMCWCWKNAPACCGPCAPRNDGTYKFWEL